jgi:hypothetical protein
MINPSLDPQMGPLNAAPSMSKLNASVMISEDEQKEIISKATAFKKSAMRHAKGKKEVMRRCYAYSKNQLYDDDLLPMPASDGSDRDANTKTNRPKVFIPVVRQNLKTIHSQVKMTIFPNDEDFFRIRSKNAAGMANEDQLTEALKYKFKEAMISEKIGASLSDASWAGMLVAFPTMRERTVWEWSIQNGENGPQYVPQQITLPACPDVEPWNPLNYYKDPHAKDPDSTKWVYVGTLKNQEVADSNVYMNKDKLKSVSSSTKESRHEDGQLSLDDLNNLSSTFEDAEDSFDYDLYYFPYLKTSKREYRNMVVGIAGEQVLIRFHPNLLPKGLNPVVDCGWMYDPRNPYSQGPAEDMMTLQRLINLLENFKIESMSRNDNRWVMSPHANLDNYNGVVGGVIVTEDPTRDVVHINGGFDNVPVITNEIGVLKGEAQTVAGSQNPFQGSANIDFKKTATEMQLLQEQFISILREVIEHLSVMGVQRILTNLMYLMADYYDEPITIPVEKPEGREYITVDLSLLKSGDYVVQMIGFNPSQSKQAQVQGMIQLLELLINNPQAVQIAEPIINKIGELQGLKNISDLLKQVKDRIALMMGVAPNGQAPPGVGINPQPAVGEVPPPIAGGEIPEAAA